MADNRATAKDELNHGECAGSSIEMDSCILSCMGMMQAGPVSFCIPVETAAHEDSAGNNFRAILQRTVLEEL